MSMGLVVLVAAIAAIVTVVAVAVVVASGRSRSARPGPVRIDPLLADDHPGGDPHRIGVGDVISYEGHDWVVRGSVAYDQRGYRWGEHLLDRVGEQVWLSVEDDERLLLVRWQAVRAPLLEPAPTVTWDGTAFELEERGRARFRAEGTTGMAPEGEVEYHDYEGSDGRLLSFERTGDTTYEVSIGVPVPVGSLTIYPRTAS